MLSTEQNTGGKETEIVMLIMCHMKYIGFP